MFGKNIPPHNHIKANGIEKIKIIDLFTSNYNLSSFICYMYQICYSTIKIIVDFGVWRKTLQNVHFEIMPFEESYFTVGYFKDKIVSIYTEHNYDWKKRISFLWNRQKVKFQYGQNYFVNLSCFSPNWVCPHPHHPRLQEVRHQILKQKKTIIFLLET